MPLSPESMAGSAHSDATMAPIATLPVFFKLAGKRVLLAGGTEPAVWKARLLAAAGAFVEIVDAAPCDAMVACAETLGDAAVLLRRSWCPDDFAGKAVAIAALERPEADAFFSGAHRAGVPVNVIDLPDLCDFQFGTIVARSPLVIGISTDGAAPVFGQALRARLEALLPAGIGAWAEAAKAWRPALRDLGASFAARRRFWEVFTDRALDGSGEPPGEADREACLAAARAKGAASVGRIVLVGIGCGEADLVTLRAVRALQSAELILHEAAVPSAVLALGRREAQRMVEPNEIATTLEMVSERVRAGQTVAWVGSGVPGLCRAWSERIEGLAAAGLTNEDVGAPSCGHCPALGKPGLRRPGAPPLDPAKG